MDKGRASGVSYSGRIVLESYFLPQITQI